jgi:hypothetical protein
MPPGMRAECYAALRGRSYFFTAAGVELACYPSSIYICGFDRGTLSAACWRAPTFQCAAFGPWVLM